MSEYGAKTDRFIHKTSQTFLPDINLDPIQWNHQRKEAAEMKKVIVSIAAAVIAVLCGKVIYDRRKAEHSAAI